MSDPVQKEIRFQKIGHHGTLDPFATGLLLVGVNEATKYFSYIDDSFKTYRATLKLGQATDTLDKTGRVTEEKGVPQLVQSDLQAMASCFVGSRAHTPPMYSAVKVGGKKLYQLARQGLEIDRQSRKIEISQFKIVEWTSPQIVFDATVSRGTYVRVLADECARALGTVGHLVELTRTELCGHGLHDAVDLEAGDAIESKKIPIEKMLNHLHRIELNEKQKKELSYGRRIPLVDIQNKENLIVASEKTFLIALHDSHFLGVVQKQEDNLVPYRLLRATADI